MSDWSPRVQVGPPRTLPCPSCGYPIPHLPLEEYHGGRRFLEPANHTPEGRPGKGCPGGETPMDDARLRDAGVLLAEGEV